MGPTVGLNRTGWIGGKVFKHTSYETSYNLGAKFKYVLDKRLNMNGYLLYSGREMDLDENGTVDEKYRYLDIPLTASYEFGNGNIKFYPMLGLHNAFLLGGKATQVVSYDPYETLNYNFFDDYPDTIKAFRYHIGYTAGVGNEFELNHKLRLFLEARYTRSFVNSLGSSDTTWFDNFGDRADVGDQEFFSFNVGVLF